MQELAAALLRRGEGFRSANHPYRWLCRAVDRVSIDMIRRRHVRATLSFDEADPIGAAPSVDPVLRQAVLESLGRLSADAQALAMMLFVDGLSQAEAAIELGVSRVTINKRAQALRSALRVELGLLSTAPTEETSL